MMIPALSGACSPAGHRAGVGDGPRLDSVFVGFHLGEARTRVLEEAQRRGLPLQCFDDETFQPFCTEGSTPPAQKPVLALGFRDERLVSLARSVTREKNYPSHANWEAEYRREFGQPVLDGWMNPYMHATMWSSADSTVLGTLTCAKPADPSTCEMGVDRMPPAHVRQMIADWREMVARTDQATAGQDSPEGVMREIDREKNRHP